LSNRIGRNVFEAIFGHRLLDCRHFLDVARCWSRPSIDCGETARPSHARMGPVADRRSIRRFSGHAAVLWFERHREHQKASSVDQLAVLSGLSGEKIQELAQLSLLDERAGRFGFRDLASARQIAKLLADGVRLSEIIRSVNEIRKWLPDTGLGSMRLRPGPSHSLEVEQAGGRTDKRGQFMLAVDDCRHNPDDLFASAQAAEQVGDVAEAERLYRILMKTDPTDASAAFNLGNMLRACGRNVEAEAALQAATGIDPAFAEAWYNLSDLLDDQGRSEAAIECLRKTLQIAPDYADAMFNLALLLQRRNEYAEAAIYWRRFLAIESRPEWATRARRSLKFCEIQQHLIA
jgi:tetratricopeptide (TPR) repeat protein